MKFGPRRPSWRKSLAARTSWKRVVQNSLGLKAPRGWGWLTNPRKAAYNRVYNRTTFGWQDLIKPRRRQAGGCALAIAATVTLAGIAGLGVWTLLVYA